MVTILRPFALLAAGLFVATASAAQEPAAPAPPVKLTLDLGFVNAAGNTNITTFSLGDELSYKQGRWEFKEIGSVIYGRTGDSTTVEQIKVTGRSDVQLVSVLRLYAGVTYERNRFAGIARRFEEFAGLGVRLIDLPATVWSLEAGSSINQQRSTEFVSGGFAALRLATVFRHNFTKTAYFQETGEYLPNLETKADWRVNSETVLIAPIAGRVALKVSYVVKFDNQPEFITSFTGLARFQKTDRIFSTAVQIAF